MGEMHHRNAVTCNMAQAIFGVVFQQPCVNAFSSCPRAVRWQRML